ncbi:nucleotidyltransferase family protein [Arhodomonas sp. SL1]|uniref:nucleotidyltransferase family protein n=1 Tax=Arhodomonas sp. SL1 TaxID=3425691 RepID=UPI003F880F92
MHPLIARKRQDIIATCQRYGVRRLEVFGSAARGIDFDADQRHSDVDFLVEFSPDSPAATSLRDYLAFRSELEGILGRPVDLLSTDSIKNPYVRAEIERSREAVHAA